MPKFPNDLKAAVDWVDRDCPWHILHSIGIPPKIVRVLERLSMPWCQESSLTHTISPIWNMQMMQPFLQQIISTALAIFDAEACKLGVRTSWDKTKIMKFGDVPSPPSLHICNNDVEFVDKFTYLGSIITNTGDLQPDINRRIGLATGVMRSLRQPLWRHSSIGLETKLRVYQASVLSVLL